MTPRTRRQATLGCAPARRSAVWLRAAWALSAVGAWLLWGGCDPSLDTRTALMVQTLVDADRDLIAARPGLVAQKYAAMAEGPQPFLRGTAGLFYRDVGRYRGPQSAVAHGDGGEAVQLYGDPHLENIGAVVDDAGMLLDGVDFDASIAGPFAWDVRRAALGLRTALSLGAFDDAALDTAVHALALSYGNTLSSVSSAAPAGPDRPTGAIVRDGTPAGGRIVQDLLADGRKRAQSREELTEYTQQIDGARWLQRNDSLVELPQPWRRDLVAATPDGALWSAYRHSRRGGPARPEQFVVLDAVQRLGSGIASLPNLRFWILVQGDGPPSGEWILEFKEERDPPQPAALLGLGPRGENGARVLAGATCLLASPTSEPDLGQVTWGGVSFQVRRVLRSRRDLDVAKLADRLQSGRYGTDDAKTLAATLGALLAGGHARCGGAGAAALFPDDGARADFAADIAASAAADHARLLLDLLRFRDVLQLRGPLLGARSQ